MEKTIYLSPHLDDAILSCGGMIWEQTQAGNREVEIWTVFAADPSAEPLPDFAAELHERWGTGREGPATRRIEDVQACAIVGAKPFHLPFQDCIYRSLPDQSGPRIKSNEDLFRFEPGKDFPLVDRLAAYLKERVEVSSSIVLPLSVGGHIDHLIVRLAAEKLNQPCLYYADFPYAGSHPEQVIEKTRNLINPYQAQISPNGLKAWSDAIAMYRSQIDSFWPSEEVMRSALKIYARSENSCSLWKSVSDSRR